MAPDYKLGGTTKNGIDCSAFVQTIFASAFGITLPRTARDQYKATRRISRTELKKAIFYFLIRRVVFLMLAFIFRTINLFMPLFRVSRSVICFATLLCKAFHRQLAGLKELIITLRVASSPDPNPFFDRIPNRYYVG